jgi:hypothetical protein
MAAGEPGTQSGRTKLESSRRVPSSGGFSMTISVRESGMPQTVSKKRHEKGGHDVQICDREADVVEASYM